MRDSTRRAMLWEQAKGVLRAITASYENEQAAFDEWDEHLEKFITDTEDRAKGGFT